jgi:hypothetical protein
MRIPAIGPVLTRAVWVACPLLAANAHAQIAVSADGLPDAHRAEVERIVALAAGEAGRLWSVDPATLAATLTIHRDPQDYVRADQDANAGRFAENWAFAKGDAAHVVLQPPMDDERLAQAGVPYPTLRLAAHETAHLVRYTLASHRSHPAWLVDGVGQVIAERAMRAAGLAHAADPWTSTYILRLNRAFTEGRVPPIADLLADSAGGLNPSERYAARWAFAAWLADAGRLEALLTQARRLGGGSNYAANLRTAALDALASEPDANAAWHCWIAQQPAPWEEVYRSLAIPADAHAPWTQIAFERTNAIAWNTAEQPHTDYRLTGEVTILPGDRTQMNLLLARSDDGFISIALNAGFGVTVFRFQREGARWTRLASAEVPALRAGEPVAFKARAAGGVLSIFIAGRQEIEIESPVALDGPWGLGAQSGSAGRWSGVSFVRAEHAAQE